MPDTYESAPPSTGKSNKTAVIVIVIIILIILALLITLGQNRKPGVIPNPSPSGKAPTGIAVTLPPPTTAVKPLTSLVLSPAQKSLAVGDKLPIAVNVSGESVQAVDIVITYDPTVLRADSITEGKVFPKFLRKTIASGTVTVSASVDLSQKTAPAAGTVFTINFTAIAPAASTKLTFNTKDTILAKGGVNYLSTATGGTYTVK